MPGNSQEDLDRMGTQEASVAIPERSWENRRSSIMKVTSRVMLYFIVIVISVMFMFPFLWTISSSLKPIREMYRYPPTLFPEKVEWQNYQHPTYPQQHGEFTPHLSAIDLLFNCGEESTRVIADRAHTEES